MKTLHILVVDDSITIRNEVKRSLRTLGERFSGVAGVEFLEAADGREALERLENRHGAVHGIVSDWEMPALDGLELVRRIRGLPGRHRTPMLMLTVTCDRTRVDEALHAGLDDYMIKPFAGADLLARFSAVIRRDAVRLLVADDSAMFRHSVVRDLHGLERRLPGLRIAEILEAADGREALSAVERRRDVDLVLSDWNMPGMDGLRFIEAMRANPFTRDLPVIMMTAYDDREAVIRAAKAGVVAYLAKPFAPEHLLDKILENLQDKLLLPAAGAPAEAESCAAGRSEGGRARADGKPFSILVADDSALIRKFVVKSLGDLAQDVGGMEWIEAADARQAVAILKAGRGRDLVIANWRLPGREGSALVHDLRRGADPAATPLVVMTTGDCPAPVLEELRGLAVRLLTKPFDGPGILALAREIAGRDTAPS